MLSFITAPKDLEVYPYCSNAVTSHPFSHVAGLDNLTNIAKCNYYGVASTWDIKKKRLVGSELLRKAFSILLIEGEGQIKPADMRDESKLPSFLL